MSDNSPAHGDGSPLPDLSIIVPALNEQDNVDPLVSEVARVAGEAGIRVELIVIDDGSTDNTLAKLHAARRQHPWVRPLHRPKPQGQSSATYAGIQAARAPWIATLDADLQNDPADLPRLLKIAKEKNVDLVQGMRAKRKDSGIRKFSTWVGRTTRKMLIDDVIIDTGCATRVLRREFALKIPLYFKGMHRFIAQYSVMLGATLTQEPVNHRPREFGESKYGMMNRAFVGLFDCIAVRWMGKRYRETLAEESHEAAQPSSHEGKAETISR